jgi:valyl-tRNA synthetase
MVKTRVYQPENFENGDAKKLSGQWTLYTVMYSIIRLVSPYIPHVTEEIYQDYYKVIVGDESVHSTDFPAVILEQDDDALVAQFAPILSIVAEVRRYKIGKQLSLGAELESLTIGTKDLDEAFVQSVEDDIVGVTKAKRLKYESDTIALAFIL